jgi:hypothetical protein
MWAGLAAVARTLEEMASGTCKPAVYVSSLDPGVGKTQLVVHFLRELLRSPDHRGVGAIIFVSRKDQIRAIAKDAALDRFAVFTSDEELNGIATAKIEDARVLFTTQQMVESRSKQSASFRAVSAFHYAGQPRAVRIWDEAMLPGQALTVSLDDLHTLPADLRRPHRDFTDALDGLLKQIDLSEDRTQFQFPDLPVTYEVSEWTALKSATGHAKETVKSVWPLFGRTVTVRTVYRKMVLDYRDSLPIDLQPLVVLDASARIRTAYDLWEKHRGGLVRLPSASKDYAGLTIGVWDRGGGKDAFLNDAATLADSVAKTINTRSDESWLVVHHMATADFDSRRLLLSRLSGDPAKVSFLTWGRHDATNEFAHIPNVILAGTLFKPVAVYEAVGRLAAGKPSSSGPFTNTDEVAQGEYAHGVLQALCRGAARRFKDGGCPVTRAFIIARKGSGIPGLLSEIFPGATVTDWQPVPKELQGQQEIAFEHIVERIEANPGDVVMFADVARHIGIAAKALKYTRKHQGFISALSRTGVKEWTDHEGTPRGFWHPFRYYFGGDDDD